MEYKTFPFECKETEEGIIEGLASTFGNIDLGSDIVHQGAFKKSINDRKGTFPLLWQHDPHEPIGVIEVTETADGLQSKAMPNMNVQRALESYHLAKQGALGGFSIGYEAIPARTDYSTIDGKRVRNLREIKLMEVSLVTFPMNTEAQITGVKSDAAGPASDSACADISTTDTTEPEAKAATPPDQPGLTLAEIKSRMLVDEIMKEIRNGR